MSRPKLSRARFRLGTALFLLFVFMLALDRAARLFPLVRSRLLAEFRRRERADLQWLRGTVTCSGCPGGEFGEPSAAAFDSAGALYVVDKAGDGRVVKLKPSAGKRPSAPTSIRRRTC
jgi:hypothetical protein